VRNRKLFWIGCGLLIVILLTFFYFWKKPEANKPVPTEKSQVGLTATTEIQATQAATVTPLPVNTQRPISTQSPAYSFDDPDWWSHAVFYEIFVRSFYDSNGDGIGDFNGITQKLDYLNDGNPQTTSDLGINAIWLMPIFPSPSYHGYDVTDYMTVNPQYGTLDDFKNLITEAHKRGIHVILDFVINHTSDQNPWFKASQDPASFYHNWYIWSATNPGYLGPWDEEVWHKSTIGMYYYGVFWSGMPDLNFNNPDVTAKIESIAKYWLTEMNVDGFRVDGARHLIEEGETQVNTPETLTWFEKFRTLYKEWKPSAMSVGEIWDSSYITTKYLQSQSFDMVFDFDLASALITTVGMGDANSLSGSIQSETNLYQGKGMATFLTNHDMNRVASQLGGDVNRAGHAATALLTAPGTPFVYYGEEIGMVGEKPDEQIRTPMQWTSGSEGGFTDGYAWEVPNFSYKTINVETEKEDPSSLLSLYRSLIHLRLQHQALLDGAYVQVQTSSPALYAAIRKQQDDIVLVMINLSGTPINAPVLSFSDDSLLGDYATNLLIGSGAFDPVVSVIEAGTSKQISLQATINADANLVFQLTPNQTK
jgi:glycosidase